MGRKGQKWGLWLGRELGLSKLNSCLSATVTPWVPCLGHFPDIIPRDPHSNPQVMCYKDRETEAQSGEMTCQSPRTRSLTRSPFWSPYLSPWNHYSPVVELLHPWNYYIH